MMATPSIDLSGIDLTTLDDITLALLDELAILEDANPSAVYWAGGMSPGQEEVHLDPHHNRLFLGANKTGKSTLLTNECWGFAAGTHPHNDRWDIPTPCTILYAVRDLERNYAEDVCRNLKEFEPPGILDPSCTYDEVRGYMVRGKQGILLANGSHVIFRSGRYDPTAIEGIWAHVCLGNEPMTRAHWGGFTRTAAQTNAPILLGFTSVGIDLSWQRKIMEEDVATKDLWGVTQVPLTPENVPWRPKEWLDKQIANCASWEKDQRIYAAWESLSPDRSYDGFTADSVSPDLPGVEVDVILGIDHGEKPGHEAAVVVAKWRDEETGEPYAYIIEEYISPGRTTPGKDATAITRKLEALGISLLAITEARGDVNSAGKSAAGQSVNRVLEGSFADLCNRPKGRPPFRVLTASKGPGSVLAGMKTINYALVDERLTVHPRCAETIRCFRMWRGTKVGADAEYTHLLDAIRYALATWLDVSTRGAQELLVG